ncbi:hypothetical protein JAAARDRAFT_35728 [Jaapia argillacea MUCL 33604]|uniref:ferric-chelate reductase (NADPH) n=1 Tax=Jaapia argillacea MUCL 33604 TaxID=933084 RepID=A0A067Q3F2_9AGAM|nr:hypothetical protein JAAARDRAFT_35728 [Jaapia argillacea MUCL 33604]
MSDSPSNAGPTGGGDPGAPSNSPDSGPSFDPEMLVFLVDMLFLVAIAFFALVALPHAIARFSRKSEWFQGLFLRKGDPEKRKAAQRGALGAGLAYGASSDDFLTIDSHSHLRPVNEKPLPNKNLPVHFPAWSALAYPLAKILRAPCYDHLSVGQVILMTAYFGVLVWASLFQSNLLTDPDRSGYIVMSQIPVVYAFATKNNLIGSLVAVGYEKLNFFHRWAGRLMALFANIHTLGYFYSWALEGSFQENISQGFVIWGLIATISLNMLVFLSTAFVRERAYNLFMFGHITGFLVFPLAACLHEDVLITYVVAAGAFFLADHILRMFKTHVIKAKIHSIPSLSLTHLSIPTLSTGWRAGQHVRIRILSSKMGLMGWSEVHPFTIASAPEAGEGLVLLCKKTGSWTKRLYGLAAGNEGGEKGSFGVGGEGEVKVMIEGPYSGSGHSVFASYSGALFVAGGSGITFALSGAQDLVLKAMAGESRVKVIEIVWVVQDPASVAPLSPLFHTLFQQTNQTSTTLRISIFYTRASFVDPSKTFVPPGITFSPGRPKIANILDGVIESTLSANQQKGAEKLAGVMVGVCGPMGLGEQVRQVVGNVDPVRREAVRGVELCEEVFGW